MTHWTQGRNQEGGEADVVVAGGGDATIGALGGAGGDRAAGQRSWRERETMTMSEVEESSASARYHVNPL